ncbi:MAG TPA: outer membrane beta-barrel protein [Candidatus Binataceae bacterium]|nr:outer membrane beta-barrel protein [Candidatus Binataceae bacterium]
MTVSIGGLVLNSRRSRIGAFASARVVAFALPGLPGWSFTLTPTYQYNMFFVRPEFLYVQEINYALRATFGSNGTRPTQVRGLIEFGVIW